MADSLAKYGIYIDDLCKIRVLEPEVANQTSKLKEECENFLSKITEFQKNIDEFLKIMQELADEVEKEKMKTIGARNLLRSVAKERDAQKQQIQVVTYEEQYKVVGKSHAQNYKEIEGDMYTDIREAASQCRQLESYLQALIVEKTMELERLRIQYDSLKKIEMEQMETIDHLTVN